MRRSEQAPDCDSRRTGTRLRGMLALNGALLVALGAVTLGPGADAQVRVRADYTMAAGGVAGAASSAVYVVDTTNQELIALTYDPNAKELIGVGHRNLGTDADSLLRVGRPR